MQWDLHGIGEIDSTRLLEGGCELYPTAVVFVNRKCFLSTQESCNERAYA